jgi:hypothetical protein
MNRKGFGRKTLWPNRGTIKAFAWRNKENNENRRIADVPADTPENLPNTTHERYRYANLIGLYLLLSLCV